MAANVVIRVESLSKEYRLGYVDHGMLYKDLQSWFARVRGLPDPHAKIAGTASNGEVDERSVDRFLALDHIDLEIRQGDILGVIGRNGAGKSTLLKILSRITAPTQGSVRVRGRIASLLEVGTGFHPELSGRENVYLNGAILGMSRSEVRTKFEEIVEFSGVGRFIDTPVKRYSSGMYVRLAFSVAAHLEPEILVVDEVLAVGDLEFQRKCLGKMQEAGSGGRTVIFVSHNLGLIRSLCHRGVFLQRGRVICDGSASDAVDRYLQTESGEIAQGAMSQWTDMATAPGSEEFRLRSIRISDAALQPRSVFTADEDIVITFEYLVTSQLRGMRIAMEIETKDGVSAFCSTDHASRDPVTPPGVFVSRCVIAKNLLNATTYRVLLHVGCPGVKVLLASRGFLEFRIEHASQHGSYFDEKWPGAVAPQLQWTSSRLDRQDGITQ